MSSSKQFKDYILEQLKNLNNITCRPMMGEFLLYLNGTLFGGIYDDRLLIKITDSNKSYNLSTTLPYPKAKTMFLVENLDDADYLNKLITTTCQDLNK